MRFDVFELPASIVAEQGRSVRRGAAYNAAHEEFRIAVETAHWEAWQSGGPFERASLTIVCFVGADKGDGKYRPQTTNRLHDALDPIYRALINVELIESMEAVPEIRTVLVRDAPIEEGFRIEIEPLEEHPRAAGAPSQASVVIEELE